MQVFLAFTNNLVPSKIFTKSNAMTMAHFLRWGIFPRSSNVGFDTFFVVLHLMLEVCLLGARKTSVRTPTFFRPESQAFSPFTFGVLFKHEEQFSRNKIGGPRYAIPGPRSPLSNYACQAETATLYSLNSTFCQKITSRNIWKPIGAGFAEVSF